MLSAPLGQQVNDFLEELRKIDPNNDLIETLVDREKRDLIIRWLEYEKGITSIEWARAIMGKNFFGISEAIKYFKIEPTKEELKKLNRVCYSKKELERCKDTHVLMAVFEIPIYKIIEMYPNLFFESDFDTYTRFIGWELRREIFYDRARKYREPRFVRWHLFKKAPLEESFNKDWEQQYRLAPYKTASVPSIDKMIYLIVGHLQNTGEKLFKSFSVRAHENCDRSTILHDPFCIRWNDSGKIDFFKGSWEADKKVGVSILRL